MYAKPPRNLAIVLSAFVWVSASGCPEDSSTPAASTPDATSPDADASDASSLQDVVEDTLVIPTLRRPGERTPRTADCDPNDEVQCALPWPSNTFMEADPTTETGLRMIMVEGALPKDPVADLRFANGFSRVSPIMTAFEQRLDEATVNLTLLVAEGDRAGEEEPVHCTYIEEDAPEGNPTAFVCYPRRPLAPATEHLAVVRTTLRHADGTAPTPTRDMRVAAGVESPTDADEAELFAYHAPARATLESAGIAPDTVLRMWDFTTRSAEDPRRELRLIRQAALDALAAGDVGVQVDEVKVEGNSPSSEIVVTGRLTGLPGYAAYGELGARTPGTGDPIVTQTIDAPFRAVVPKGTGDYRIVVFCHGLGGNVSDGSFDELVTSHGAMKLGIEVDGWTDVDMGDTLTRFFAPLEGTSITAAMTLQTLAGSSAVLESMRNGALSDLFAAAEIGGVSNPAAGRRPMSDKVIWAGGSLGGTMGLVFAKLEPSIIGGVLNVPGAAYTHWLPGSDIFFLVDVGLVNRYDSRVVANNVVAVAQTIFDRFDGANWADAPDEEGGDYLVQISVGDPVMPNVGSNMVATSLNALHVGVPLYDMQVLETGDRAEGRSGVTQFDVRIPDASGSNIHGFTARNNEAGLAAQDQFILFADSLWADAPLIEQPAACLSMGPDTSCDFTEVITD